MVPFALAFYIATLAQAILYGFYVETSVICLRWLLYKHKGWELRASKDINWRLLAATIILFMLETIDLGISVLLCFSLAEGDVLRFNRMGIVNVIIETTAVLITDAILIFRCWVIYNKSWRVVSLPLVLWLADIVCVVLISYWLVKDVNDPNDLTWSYPSTRATAAAFFACNVVNNIYSTGAISYRILKVAKHNKSTYLYITFRIFAESGVICATTSLMLIIASLATTGQNLAEILLGNLNFTMSAIAFNLILIRVRQLQPTNVIGDEGRRP